MDSNLEISLIEKVLRERAGYQIPPGAIPLDRIKTSGNEGEVASIQGGKAVWVPKSIAASAVTVTPAGGISSTDAQSAIQELDSEKQPLDSDLTTIAGLVPSNDDIIQRKAGAWTNRTIAQVVSDLDTGGLAPKASPTFTGDPQAPTPASSDNDTSIATTAFVKAQKVHDLAAPTSALAMNSQKITGLAAATANGDAVRYEQINGVYQPIDSDLTTIAGLTATTDNFIQAKSSAWASRTLAEVAADLLSNGGTSGFYTTVYTTVTSTGNVSITGVGFTPKIIICLGSLNTGAVLGGGYGYAVASGQAAISYATGRQRRDSAGMFQLINSAGTVLKDFRLVSMDSDGFTFNRSTNDGTAYGVYFICFR